MKLVAVDREVTGKKTLGKLKPIKTFTFIPIYSTPLAV